LLHGGARNASIACLIRAHTSRPSLSPRSSIKILTASRFKLGIVAVLSDK
jgi:hypothetical protein